MRQVPASVGVLVAGLALTSAAIFLLARSVIAEVASEDKIKELEAELEREKRLRREERSGRTAAEKRLRSLDGAGASGEAASATAASATASTVYLGGQAVAAALDAVHFHVVAGVKSCFPDRRGVPRQPMLCSATRGEIVFCNAVAPSGAFIGRSGGAGVRRSCSWFC